MKIKFIFIKFWFIWIALKNNNQEIAIRYFCIISIENVYLKNTFWENILFTPNQNSSKPTQLNSTQFNQTQANPTKSNQTQPHSNKFK